MGACIKHRTKSNLTYLCLGTIVNAAMVTDTHELARMQGAKATINNLARDFATDHGLEAGNFGQYLRAIFGERSFASELAVAA